MGSHRAARELVLVDLAIVGAGKMGSAVALGAIRAGVVERRSLGVYHPEPARREALAQELGATPLDDEGVHQARRVLIAVKPQSFREVAPLIAQRKASFISLMAGVPAETIARRLGSRRIVRAMPNLGASLGVSSTAITGLADASSEDLEFAERLFGAVGSVHRLPEALFDAFTGLAGSGPAFVAVVAEALADGGVRSGFTRHDARALTREVLLATARLLEEMHPSEVKDAVASAGGTAIAGVRSLEQHGARFALMDAVEKASARAAELRGNES